MENTAQHKFEIAGLGKAPFRCVRVEVRKHVVPGSDVVRPGASCDYCSTAIMDCFIIEGADGAEFKVGCECVKKTGDRGLMRVVAKKQTEARNAAADARIERAVALFGEESIRAKMVANQEAIEGPQRHLDPIRYVEWMLKHAGRAGKLKAARLIEAADCF